jgi:hypothetical protein
MSAETVLPIYGLIVSIPNQGVWREGLRTFNPLQVKIPLSPPNPLVWGYKYTPNNSFTISTLTKCLGWLITRPRIMSEWIVKRGIDQGKSSLVGLLLSSFISSGLLGEALLDHKTEKPFFY